MNVGNWVVQTWEDDNEYNGRKREPAMFRVARVNGSAVYLTRPGIDHEYLCLAADLRLATDEEIAKVSA
jgi:hypothetical protein